MKNKGIYVLLLWLMIVVVSGCSRQEEGNKKMEITSKTKTEVANKAEEKELIKVDHPVYIAEGIRKISMIKEGQSILQLSYEPKEYESSHEYWKIKVPYGDSAIVDTEVALQLFKQTESLDFQTVSEVVDPAVTGIEEAKTSIELEFCQTSLEEREASLLDAEYDKSTSPSYQAKADSTCTLLIGNHNGKGAYYTALEVDTNRVFLMKEESIDQVLTTDRFGLLIKVAASPNIDTVNEVTMQADGKTRELKIEKGAYYLDDKELEEASYHAIYAELLSVFVVAETEEIKEGQELLTLLFKRNREGAEDVELVYSEYDDTYASVSVNGVERLLVNKTDVEQLKKRVETDFE